MEVEHPPSFSIAAAHRKPVSAQSLFRRFNRIIVGIPQGVTEGLHFMRFHPVAQVGRIARVAIPQVGQNLIAAKRATLKQLLSVVLASFDHVFG
jgi:hypothetical protein